jgi:hypothetical protein
VLGKPEMANSAFIVRDGDEHHQVLIGDRDISLLWGPFFTEGAIFSWTFGFYENFSVARGIPKGAHVVRPGGKLFNAAYGLQHAIKRDIDLLQFDYSFSIGNERPRKGPESVVIRGRTGVISTSPHGFCYAQLSEAGPIARRIGEIIDLRVIQDTVADGQGAIALHRENAKTAWPDVLPPLLEFLRPRVKKKLIVEIVDRVK